MPPNCTDRLQPLDVSINKSVKDFLRKKLTDWYAEKIVAQKDSGTATQTVGMKLSIMKPIEAKWMIEASDYIQSHPEMIRNGFKNVSISDLKAGCLLTLHKRMHMHVPIYYIYTI